MLDFASTRAEVLAAVDDSRDRLEAAVLLLQELGALPARTPCRSARTSGLGVEGLPEMRRQAAAGEEDQSVPGWDQGA